MEQSPVVAARPRRRGRMVVVLATVLLSAFAFVGSTASPASAESCGGSAVGTWGTPNPAQLAYVTDMVVTFTSGCNLSVAVWGSCTTERVDYWSSCYWGRKTMSGGVATFNLNGYQRRVSFGSADSRYLNYAARWSNGFQTASTLVRF